MSLYGPKKEIINKLQNLYGEILKLETCSIHVRRGDYISLPNHHPSQPIDYFENAVKIIGEDKHFLIFLSVLLNTFFHIIIAISSGIIFK